MSWSVFVYTVIPTGSFLVAMLASGKQVPMWAASKVLCTPVTFGSVQYSLGAVLTALCLAMSYISLLSLRRAELRAEGAASNTATPTYEYDKYMRDVFHQGRNLYLSLLGLMLWATAWRLKVLHDVGQLQSPVKPRVGRPLAVRIVYVALGIAALLLADIPLCRVNYNIHLATFVTPKKRSLLPMAPKCEGIVLQSAGGECRSFCEDVLKLSHERHQSIVFARNWHVLGRWAAELFDDSRGVEQGTSRIEALFEKKSCGEVLRSVDKSNQMVNYLCITFAGLSIIGAFTMFAAVLHEHEQRDGAEHAHRE